MNCVPFYRGAVNSVALKQSAVQNNFPLLQKLGLAEKAAKDPTIGSVWLLAGSKIGSLFLDFSTPKESSAIIFSHIIMLPHIFLQPKFKIM